MAKSTTLKNPELVKLQNRLVEQLEFTVRDSVLFGMSRQPFLGWLNKTRTAIDDISEIVEKESYSKDLNDVLESIESTPPKKQTRAEKRKKKNTKKFTG